MAGVLFFVLAVISCPSPLSLLFAVAVHESGHLIAARVLGWGPPRVMANGVGLRLSYYGTHATLPSIAVSLAGCFAGTLCALFPFLPEDLRLYSLGLSLVNLAPVMCLDGGNTLLCALEAVILPDRAFRAVKATSVATVILLWVISVAVQLKGGINLTLLAVSVYLTVSVLSDS